MIAPTPKANSVQRRCRMSRLLPASVVATVAVFGAIGSAVAAECPALIHRIYGVAGNRFDRGADDAKKKAAEAARLHGEGKHQEAEKIARQGLVLLCYQEAPTTGARFDLKLDVSRCPDATR
jgi:hypothetical protein